MSTKTQRLLPYAFGVVTLAVVVAAIIPATAADTPLIAELVATPEAFSGKTVTIYGLVVAVPEGGGSFMLQDVSQKPLRILTGKGMAVKVGDQVLVRGVFKVDGRQQYISAERIEPTKVTGGG